MTESASSTSPGPIASVRVGERVAGKYLVERELGRGGMGVVFAARDTSIGRPVALKVLRPGLATSEHAAQRFMREAQAATRITSEHVVKLLEINALPDETPVLVLEYLEGRDLRAVLRDQGPLGPELAVDYVLQALQAVAEGHMHGVVHRDLKPSNLFVTARADGSSLLKVLDFGIAKTLEPDSAQSFALTGSDDVRLGSPTYMPPEQLHNPRDVDERADIWSLGITLHELLTGSPPFQAQSFTELVLRISNEAPPSLASKQQGAPLPVGLNEVVVKCLQKSREDRYANAGALASALAPYGSGDARLSLSRVLGLKRARVTTAVGPSSGRQDLAGTCETTLPAPFDRAPEATEAAPPSGTRRVPRDLLRNLIGVAALAALVLGVLIRTLTLHRALPDADPVSAGMPAALTTAQPLPAMPASPDPASPLPAAVLRDTTLPAPAPLPASAPSASARRAASTTQVAAFKGAPSAQATVAVPASAAANPPPKSASPEPTAPGLGPSPYIESLIEKRH